VLQPADIAPRLAQFVSHHQRRHHRQPRIADLAELAAQVDDALVDVVGESLKVLLLPVLAGKAELAASNRSGHLRHGFNPVRPAPTGSRSWPRRYGPRFRDWRLPA